MKKFGIIISLCLSAALMASCGKLGGNSNTTTATTEPSKSGYQTTVKTIVVIIKELLKMENIRQVSLEG